MEISSYHRHQHQNIRKLKGLLYIENRTLRFKAFYFIFFFGCGSLRNYLPVYFRHIGLNAVLTGVLTGVRPFTGFISAPFFSYLADKTGLYKSILLISLLMSVFSYFSLSFVAIVRQIEQSPGPINDGNQSVSYLTATSGFHPEFLTVQGKIPKLIPGTDVGKLNGTRSNNIQLVQSAVFSNDTNTTTVLSETTVFFVSFALVVLGDFFNAPVGAIMSSTIIYWEGSSQFGKQRVFGAIGFGLGCFLTGLAIDKTSNLNYFHPKQKYTKIVDTLAVPNYLTAFFIYLGINCLLLILVSCGLDVARERKSTILWAHVKRILNRGIVVCFLIYVFIMGVVGGIIMLFLFWFLENLGASQSLLGLSSAVMSFSEIPIFSFCAKMIEAIGHVGVLMLSLTCSIIRLICYIFLHDPWYVLLIEPLHGISLAAMWSTSISFASRISSPQVYTTMEGIITGVHFGLGWGLGAVLGGTVYHSYGPRNLFKGCIALCCVGYVFLALVFFLQKQKGSIAVQYCSRKGTFIIPQEYEEIQGETVPL